MSRSEIASFRSRQASEEASACLALVGPAIVASHESIEARAEMGGQRILQLLAAGRQKEAHRLMELADWGVGEDARVER